MAVSWWSLAYLRKKVFDINKRYYVIKFCKQNFHWIFTFSMCALVYVRICILTSLWFPQTFVDIFLSHSSYGRNIIHWMERNFSIICHFSWQNDRRTFLILKYHLIIANLPLNANELERTPKYLQNLDFIEKMSFFEEKLDFVSKSEKGENLP